MSKYKVELNSGKSIAIEDERSLSGLALALCQDGFIHVVRLDTGGYRPETETKIALFERTVASIETV